MKNIDHLPPSDRAVVICFADLLDAERRLSGPELTALAEQMTKA